MVWAPTLTASPARKFMVPRLVAAAVAMVVTLVAVEASLRAVDLSQGRIRRSDPVYHHAMRPHRVSRHKSSEFDVRYHTNAYSLRGGEIALPKPAGRFRVLLLGDSFTFGSAVALEDTYAWRLEQGLNRGSLGRRVEVVNAGCSSYSPILEYLWLERRGLALEPDLVVLAYDISDVHDDHKYGRIAERGADGRPRAVPAARVEVRLLEIGAGNLRVGHLLRRTWLQLLGQERTIAHTRRIATRIAGDIVYDRDTPVRETGGDWQPHFDASARNLDYIAGLLESHGIAFAMVTYPYGTLVNAHEWADGRRARGFDAKLYTTRLFAHLEEWADGRGVPFHNMTPDFQAAAAVRSPLFFAYDGHFTPMGHAVAADALERFLRERGLVPSDGPGDDG